MVEKKAKSFRLTQAQCAALKEEAAEQRVTQGEIVRRALDSYLSSPSEWDRISVGEPEPDPGPPLPEEPLEEWDGSDPMPTARDDAGNITEVDLSTPEGRKKALEDEGIF